jgi:putative flippase GtrA
MLGFCIAVILGYIFGRIWIFTETAQKVKRGLFIALLVSIIVLLFITSTMWILVEIVHINYMIARISIAIIAGILNFILDSKYTYIVSHFKN